METAVLTGKGRLGDFVHESQDMGTKQGFKNVSKIWLGKCMTYDEGFFKLAQGYSETEDILASLYEMQPKTDDNGSFVMKHLDGREFRPTEHAVAQMANWSGVGSWYAGSLTTNPTDRDEEELFCRDSQDAETLVMALRNGFRRIDPNKKFFWRTREDGTLRAMLTESYAVVNNEWFLRSLQAIIPGGMLSHWRGDCDTVYGNILIPDSIREEKDSDYGGMISVGNSEIGERRVSSVPSVFRAICMNGCIWDQESGHGIRQVHRGNIDLDALFNELKTNLEQQIPLVSTGIDRLLGTRQYTWSGSPKPLLAQVAIDNKLSKRQASAVLSAYQTEQGMHGNELIRSLFGVIAGLTRAGQKMGNQAWVKFDEIGGKLSGYLPADWKRLKTRAKGLKPKEVDGSFADDKS